MFYAFIRGDERERERRIVRSLVGAGAAGSISANRIFSLPKNIHPLSHTPWTTIAFIEEQNE